MAIGAVAISLMMAIFGSVFGTAIHGLDIWQGFALYVSLGVLTLATMLTASALAMTRENF